jgi:pantoate--beta-alanine ligase
LFRPLAREVYAADRSTFVEETSLSSTLEGKSRPGHFRGVCTVVAKLFNILAPDAAVFGEKDFQQLAIIRRMVRDLNFKIEHRLQCPLSGKKTAWRAARATSI